MAARFWAGFEKRAAKRAPSNEEKRRVLYEHLKKQTASPLKDGLVGGLAYGASVMPAALTGGLSPAQAAALVAAVGGIGAVQLGIAGHLDRNEIHENVLRLPSRELSRYYAQALKEQDAKPVIEAARQTGQAAGWRGGTALGALGGLGYGLMRKRPLLESTVVGAGLGGAAGAKLVGGLRARRKDHEIFGDDERAEPATFLDKDAGVFDALSRRFGRGKALVPYTSSAGQAATELMTDSDALRTLGGRIVRRAGQGGLGGSVLGGAYGAVTHDGEEHPDRSRLESAARGAATGSILGAGAGTLFGGVRGVRAGLKHLDARSYGLSKTEDGTWSPGSKALKKIFEEGKDHVVEDMVVPRPDPLNLFRGARGTMSNAEKAEMYKQVMDDFKMSPYGPLASRSKDKREFFNRYSNAFLGKYDADQASGPVKGLLKRLKDEGIDNPKAFARKYHPDVNKNVPKDIAENFGAVIEAMKGGSKAVRDTNLDKAVDRYRKFTSGLNQSANSAVRRV